MIVLYDPKDIRLPEISFEHLNKAYNEVFNIRRVYQDVISHPDHKKTNFYTILFEIYFNIKIKIEYFLIRKKLQLLELMKQLKYNSLTVLHTNTYISNNLQLLQLQNIHNKISTDSDNN